MAATFRSVKTWLRLRRMDKACCDAASTTALPGTPLIRPSQHFGSTVEPVITAGAEILSGPPSPTRGEGRIAAALPPTFDLGDLRNRRSQAPPSPLVGEGGPDCISAPTIVRGSRATPKYRLGRMRGAPGSAAVDEVLQQAASLAEAMCICPSPRTGRGGRPRRASLKWRPGEGGETGQRSPLHTNAFRTRRERRVLSLPICCGSLTSTIRSCRRTDRARRRASRICTASECRRAAWRRLP